MPFVGLILRRTCIRNGSVAPQVFVTAGLGGGKLQHGRREAGVSNLEKSGG